MAQQRKRLVWLRDLASPSLVCIGPRFRVDNIASQRVAEKVGAVRESVLRKRLLTNGDSQDAVLFSLTPEDLM